MGDCSLMYDCTLVGAWSKCGSWFLVVMGCGLIGCFVDPLCFYALAFFAEGIRLF